jgi:hypothetical protein
MNFDKEKKRSPKNNETRRTVAVLEDHLLSFAVFWIWLCEHGQCRYKLNRNKPNITRHKQVTSWTAILPAHLIEWQANQLLYYFNTGAEYQESVETLPSLTGSMWYESKEGLSQPYQWLKLKMRLILEDIQSIHYPLQTNVRAK